MSYNPPNVFLPTGPLVTPFSPEAIGVAIAAAGLAAPGASSIIPNSGTASLVPFQINNPVLVRALFWMNGGTVVGHYDAGIYTVTKNRVVSTGSRGQAVVNALQVVSVAPTLLLPGLYYLALATGTDSTGITRSAWTLAADGRLHGTLRADSAATGAVMPLPQTITLSLTSGFGAIPLFGFATRTLVTS